jgi:membrane protease YdiL (CAAX protease family)
MNSRKLRIAANNVNLSLGAIHELPKIHCMSQNSTVSKWKYTLGRVLLFCISCAIILAAASRLTQGMRKEWSQHLLITIAAIVTFGLTILFVHREGLRLSDVGVVPGRRTIPRLCIGFSIGIFLALLQPALVLLFGHLKLVINPKLTFGYVISHLLLYFLVACREELAFRGYPLRSLNYVMGSWKAQLIIAVIFSLEHVIGGMTWVQAFLGSGVGAVLFGVAALKTKGIAMPMGIHAAWNFGQWCVGFKNEPGIWQAITEKGYEVKVEQAGLICYLLVMGLAILAFYYYGNTTNSNSSDIHINPT